MKGSGGYIGDDGVPRLNVLDLHKKIREMNTAIFYESPYFILEVKFRNPSPCRRQSKRVFYHLSGSAWHLETLKSLLALRDFSIEYYFQ